MLANIRETLAKEYPYRIELHAHTGPASPCGKASPEETVQLYLDAGFDGMVITNHFCRDSYGDVSVEEIVNAHLSDYERACKAAEGTKLKVYFGAEIRFNENSNDYLLYGVNREILETVYGYFAKGLATFRAEVKLPDSVFVQAHPFRNNCVPAEASLLDGMEVFNMHPNHNSRCAMAAMYAKENGISLITAGTDFHNPHPGYIATTALRSKILPEDSYQLAEILKSGDFFFEVGDHFML